MVFATVARRVLYKPKVNRMVTYTLSPFQQEIVAPMFRNIPEKIMKKIFPNVFSVGPAACVLFGTVWWGEHEYHKNVLAARPKF